MLSKVKVHGKAQNRTALGIYNAYLVIYPHATLEDLRKAFPNELTPDNGVKENIVNLKDIKNAQSGSWDGYFSKSNEVLNFANGTKGALVKMWTKPSFERLIAHAKQYGIEVASFEEADKGIGKKGHFWLEYLNGFVPPTPAKSKTWLYILIAAIIIAIAILIGMRSCQKTETVVQTVVVHDTVFVKEVVIQEVEKIEKDYNAVQYEKGTAALPDGVKPSLQKLAELLKQHGQLKVRVEGHTSAEGDPDFNQKLSEQRAQSAVDYLLSLGVPASQISSVGKGSSEPIDPDNLEVNRRTEFVVE